MTLIKTSLLNGIAVIVKMLTLLGINKILAIYVGPAGYAALGQFQNAVQMISSFASGAINTGVTKYTAEYSSDELKQRRVWSSAGGITLLGSLLTTILLIVFNRDLAIFLLRDESLGGVFVWFGIGLVFFAINALLLAILNGKKEISRYVGANMSGSLLSLVVTGVLTVKFGVFGALVALAVYQSVSFFTTLVFCRNLDWFRFSYLFFGIDREVAKNLLKFAAMAATSAACVPVSHMLIRSHLVLEFGLEVAGYWEAMWRLSAAYLLVVTTTLSVYFLPRFAEISDRDEVRKEIVAGYKVIMPMAVTAGLAIYLFRDFIIQLLFSESFTPMRELFAWQLIGDTLKIGSWVLAYLLIGKAMIKHFIVAEVFFAASFYLLTKLFTSWFSVEGVVVAHAVNYLLYWIAMGGGLSRYLSGK